MLNQTLEIMAQCAVAVCAYIKCTLSARVDYTHVCIYKVVSMNKKNFAKEFEKTWNSYHSNEFEADLRDVIKTIPQKGFNTLIWGIGSLAEALCSQAKGRFPNLTFCHSAGVSRNTFFGHACQNSEDVDYQDFDVIILTPKKESKNIFINQILPRLTQKNGQKFFYLDSKKDQLFLRRIRL